MKSTILILTAVLSTNLFAIPRVEKEVAPRHAFALGQQLAYDVHTVKTSGAETKESRGTVTVWVVGANADGTFRLAVRETTGESSLLARFDAAPNGAVAPGQRLPWAWEPARVVPRLPDAPAQHATAWTAASIASPGSIEYRRETVSERSLVFSASFRGAFEVGWNIDSSSRFTFDTQAGHITTLESQILEHWPGEKQSTEKRMLSSTSQLEPEALSALVGELDIFFAAEQRAADLILRASKETASAESLVDEARATLVTAKSQVKQPWLVSHLEQAIQAHDKRKPTELALAKYIGGLVGTAAPAWKAEDAAGKTYASEDFRGKVVVLDFWFRGCGGCMMSMPFLERLSRKYKNSPVAVLGLNVDRKPEDPQWVIEKLGITYQTLKGLPVAKPIFGVQRYPTLMVIDQKGTIRYVEIGYHAEGEAEIDAMIAKLLAESPRP